MNTIKQTGTPNPKMFNEMRIGQAFVYKGTVYIKTTKVNAFNLVDNVQTGQLSDATYEMFPVDTIIEIVEP